GSSEDARLVHFRAGVAGGLDLGRGDILSATDDDILLPVDDEQIAVFIEVTDVAGADIAVSREQRGRRFRHLPITFDVRGASDADFADLANWQVAVAFAENCYLDVWLVRSAGGPGLCGVIAPKIVAADGIRFR